MSRSGSRGHGGEFFALLEELRVLRAGPLAGDPPDRVLARAAGVSPTTIGDWLRGERFPKAIDRVLVMVRMMRETASRRRVTIQVSGAEGLLDEDRWRAAYQQEAQLRAGVISAGVEHAQAAWALAGPRTRVREANPRRLGVHAAISVPGVPDEVPPEYVPRDTDAAEHGVRATVAAMAERGGLVLLVGGSSAGKTRTAFEAARVLLPDWWLVHPAGPGEVGALAAAPPARTVVWLDELQRYLDGEHGLTGSIVRALLDAPGPVVIIATLWPDRYAAYTTVPAPGEVDPQARAREVLDLARVIRISGQFSPAEQDRARAAAARDRRLALALAAKGYGLTQTLAAAPQLVARWEDALDGSPYAWAVLTAALDAARLGARAPLSADLLRAAAPGYCTSGQQAAAPGNWFEQALAYATARLYGAAAALSPAGSGMGQVDGYTAADYLIQHASRERRAARMPASTWDAILNHVRDPADAARLAGSARGRLLYRYAIPLYGHAADAGDRITAQILAALLAERGDLDELRTRADASDQSAAATLAVLLAELGDLDELRTRAADGGRAAAVVLAALTAGQEYANELLTRASDGDEAAVVLTTLMTRRGKPDGLPAEEIADDRSTLRIVAGMLAERLAGLGDLDELRTRADASDEAAVRMAADREDLEELRTRADAGDQYAAMQLAERLAELGDLDELRTRADAGNQYAAPQLAKLLAQHRNFDELRTRAGAGDQYAGAWLARLLAWRGDLDEAVQIQRALADAGYGDFGQLAELLTKQGREGEAEQLRRFGLNPDGSIAHM